LSRTIRRGLETGEALDGIEVINAAISENAQVKLDGICRSFAGLLAVVGFSDAHEQSAIGAAYTAFPGNTVEDFLRALRERTTGAVCERRPRLEGAAKAFTTRR